MGILSNFLTIRSAKNAVQQQGASSRNSSQLASYNGVQSDIYTRDTISTYINSSSNQFGLYDNFYGDYNRIVQTAPTFEFYYVKDDNVVDTGDFIKFLEKPNEDFSQFKVWQQIYSEMITKGYSDVFLWRKNGKTETNVFEKGKKYNEDDFRGITLVSGYEYSKLSILEKSNIIRITNGVSQSNVFMGYSPTQAANSWRKMQDSMGLHMTSFAKNAGMPIGKFIITAPNPEEYAKMRDKLDDKISGARNNGKVLYDYRPSDSKVTQIEWIQFTSRDVQDYTKQLEFAEKKMSQSFGVPGTVKGTNDGENYATARVSEHIFIKYTIKSLVEDFQSQLVHHLEKRFDLSGEIRVDVPLPEIADESLVKIQSTTAQVALFDQKITEGYSPQSIVDAFNLPQSFLLLEKEPGLQNSQNNPEEAKNEPETIQEDHDDHHIHNCSCGLCHSEVSEARDEFEREYQSKLTKSEREEIEGLFDSVTRDYAEQIIANGIKAEVIDEYIGKMSVVFTDQYSKLYNRSIEDVADALVTALGSVDVESLKLTDEELEYAKTEYEKRVADFSRTFAENVSNTEGETLAVKMVSAEPNIKRVVVTESEHTRIVSELKSWTKSQEEFPVRVYKTWNTRAGACSECLALQGTKIDVTALFAGRGDNSIDEIYEVQGGGLHPNCRCFVQYEMESDK